MRACVQTMRMRLCGSEGMANQIHNVDNPVHRGDDKCGAPALRAANALARLAIAMALALVLPEAATGPKCVHAYDLCHYSKVCPNPLLCTSDWCCIITKRDCTKGQYCKAVSYRPDECHGCPTGKYQDSQANANDETKGCKSQPACRNGKTVGGDSMKKGHCKCSPGYGFTGTLVLQL